MTDKNFVECDGCLEEIYEDELCKHSDHKLCVSCCKEQCDHEWDFCKNDGWGTSQYECWICGAEKIVRTEVEII